MPEGDEARAARDEDGASAQRAFSISGDRADDVYLLKAGGELDLVTREALSDELKRAEASEAKGILLDLSGVTFIDSSGLSVLVHAYRRLAAKGRRLRFLPVSREVRIVFELTGLMGSFEFVEP